MRRRSRENQLEQKGAPPRSVAGDWSRTRGSAFPLLMLQYERKYPMQMSEVHDYASRLLREHGDKAQLIAAQRVLECEKRGDRGEAEDWRRIRDTLKEMQGPHVS